MFIAPVTYTQTYLQLLQDSTTHQAAQWSYLCALHENNNDENDTISIPNLALSVGS